MAVHLHLRSNASNACRNAEAVMCGIKGGKTRDRSPKSDSKPLKVHPAGEFSCGKKAFIKAGILLPTFM